NYFMISYGEDGFRVENKFAIGDSMAGIRGLYIGGCLYIYQNNLNESRITSFDLNDYRQVDEEIMVRYEYDRYSGTYTIID
ncbi:MAG: hypothetical protein IJT91_04520, partial [Clostridia bacterium]|nr:hypothetical protein [Clostridia bacterium]